MRNAICLKVRLLIQIFHAKKYFYNNSTVKLKSENIKIISSMILISFSSFVDHKKQNIRFCSSHVSHLFVSCKNEVLKKLRKIY